MRSAPDGDARRSASCSLPSSLMEVRQTMDIHDVLEQYRPGSKRTLTVTLDGDVADQLEAAANKLDVSRHDFVRAALQLALGQASDGANSARGRQRSSSRPAPSDAAEEADDDSGGSAPQASQRAASRQSRSNSGQRSSRRRQQRQEPDASSASDPAPGTDAGAADPPVAVEDINFDDI